MGVGVLKGDRVRVARQCNPLGSAHRFIGQTGVVTLTRPSERCCMVSMDGVLGADQVYFEWTELEHELSR